MKDRLHRNSQLLTILKRLSIGQLDASDVSEKLENLLTCDFHAGTYDL